MLSSISISISVCAASSTITLLVAVKFAEGRGIGGPLRTPEERCCVKNVGGTEPCSRVLERYL